MNAKFEDMSSPKEVTPPGDLAVVHEFPIDLKDDILVKAEHAMLNLHYRYHDAGSLWAFIGRVLLVLAVIYLATRSVEVYKHIEFHGETLKNYGPWVAVPLLFLPGEMFSVFAPLALLFMLARDVIRLRAGRCQYYNLPVRHDYLAVSGTLRRTGSLKGNKWSETRLTDQRFHASSQSDLKYLNPLSMQVEYVLKFLYVIPILRVRLSISGELLSQVLVGKNMVASTDIKTTAMRMETFAASLQVININRTETLKGIQRVPDTTRVAYGAYRQYLEQRLAVPFPFHPLRP